MKHLVIALSLISTFSVGSAMAQQSCLMNLSQQRQMILNEGPAAMKGQGSECFERLVRSQMDMLKKTGASNADDRVSVIQDLMASAIKGEIFESGAHE